MIFRDRNDRGFFIGGAEIACFIIINIMMLASFGLGSSIRKTQDAKYLSRQLEEQRKQEEAEAARKKLLQEKAALEKPLTKKDPPKIGAINTAAGPARPRNYNTSIVSSAPDQFKRMVPVKRPSEQVKQPPVKTTPVKTHAAAAKKTDEVRVAAGEGDTDEAGASEDPGFAGRMSSLFFSDVDSLGVELYDYKLAKNSAGREIAILRLLGAVKLGDDETSETEEGYHLSVKSSEVALKYPYETGSDAKTPDDESDKTSETSLKPKELAAKFLYRYKETTYIATNGGLYSIPNDRISEIKEGEKTKPSKIDKFMHDVIAPCDIIALAGDGEFLFVGTPSTVYMIDLSQPLASDIGIDELFENSDWYSMCFFGEKLYLANFESIFYYDMKLSKWFTVPYEKFAGLKKCKLQNLTVYKSPATLATNYMLISKDYGIITDRMPPFDPAALKYESAQVKPKLLKKIFNRDLLKTSPAFVYDEPGSVWFSFEPYAKDPYELIRYDKKTDKYERFNSSEKLKCVYAIDIALHSENLMFAVNGEDLFAIIKMWGDKESKVYGFMPLASISGCFSVTFAGNYVICGTLDGRIYKIDASEIIKSVQKL
jgi:hypothetical protein